MIDRFEKITNTEEAHTFLNIDEFRFSKKAYFLTINTKKMANEEAIKFSKLDKTTRVTIGYNDPNRIITFLDLLNYQRPKYTFINPVGLRISSNETFNSVNIHNYSDNNIFILSIINKN